MSHKPQQNISIKNRKASFNYELIERFVAGLKLVGTEIKSIRNGKVNLTDAYCTLIRGEMYVINLHIAEYELGTINNHIAKRDRKLLLNKKEIEKLDKKVKESGLTIVPIKLFVNDRGLAKLEIALARGKKTYDKRETLKSKDAKRDIDRAMKF
ncbi:SsrA-binding protein [Draconibacterium orientale]|uniref:SsrA-binding protein n=1 Tax=Draconibacterium orientale TaxID=1168034 RepID=X5DC49_9BACT|nr:SsrA-binding protein SmpB [Draconibacterium orientale]AHW60383.1 single-stranded DNA-binding protein [Draconibacterium orientale]SET81028.1 SsrA-binding protein [Draconibacterium orientale]